MAMLEVKDLQVYYGVIQALKGISFEVNQGEVIALIGANGAGKTTTFQTLTGTAFRNLIRRRAADAGHGTGSYEQTKDYSDG